MPRIPIVDAGGSLTPIELPRLRFPSGAEQYQASARAFGQIAESLTSIANIELRLQRQQEEIELLSAASEFESGLKILHDEAKRVRPILQGSDVVSRQKDYLKGANALTTEVESRLTSDRVKRLFRGRVGRLLPAQIADVYIGAMKDWGVAQVAEIDKLGADESRRAAVAASPEERNEIVNNYLEVLRRAEASSLINPVERQRRADQYEQKVLDSQMSILARSATGRQQLDELERAGYFDKLDPKRREEIRTYAIRAEEHDERHARLEHERAAHEVHEDIKIEIGNMLAEGRRSDASDTLEFYARHRMLPARDIEHLRKEIASPTRGERPSDTAIAGRVLLDVESINPRTTEYEIDDLYARHSRGEPGLSLTDATKAKNQLRSTRVAIQNKQQSEIVRRHNQAEQELNAMLGIREGLIPQLTGDDPSLRLKAVLLPELRKRSVAFGGSEEPEAIIESFRSRVRDALGKPALLRPGELKGLYPDLQSLDRARRDGMISEEQFKEQLKLRQLPAAAPSAPTTPSPTPTTPTPRQRF